MRTHFDEMVEFFLAMEEETPFAGLLDELVAWAALPEGARVADVGAGPGGLLRRLPRTKNVALDLSFGMSLRAMSLGHAAVQADAMLLPLQRSAFDAVFATNLLHLVPDPLRVLKEARRVLRPGGAFYCIVPGPRMGEAALVEHLRRTHGAEIAEKLAGWGRSADNNRRFTPEQLGELFSQAGFAGAETRLRWDDLALLGRAAV